VIDKSRLGFLSPEIIGITVDHFDKTKIAFKGKKWAHGFTVL
jgi:hypothetical protein